MQYPSSVAINIGLRIRRNCHQKGTETRYIYDWEHEPNHREEKDFRGACIRGETDVEIGSPNGEQEINDVMMISE